MHTKEVVFQVSEGEDPVRAQLIGFVEYGFPITLQLGARQSVQSLQRYGRLKSSFFSTFDQNTPKMAISAAHISATAIRIAALRVAM